MEIPGLIGIDHVAIAVKPGGMQAQIESYKKLGFIVECCEIVEGLDHVREVFLRVGDGGAAIQLLEPLKAESPIAKLLARNGGRGGFAHVAYRVADIQHAFTYMKENGFRIIDAAPRPGSRNTTVFFVHPESFGLGYLMEVVQAGSPGDSAPEGG